MRGCPTEIRVLFGTETGNAELVAGNLVEAAAARGLDARLNALNDVAPEELIGAVPVLVVIATTGDGDMPYTADTFWEKFSADPGPELEGTPFAVLGLGDTGYFDFCRAAELLDERFAGLGGARLLAMRTCDWDFEGPAARWVTEVLDLLADAPAAVPAADRPAPNRPVWNRERPYPATVRASHWLTGAGALKPVRHVELSIDADDLSYRPGDSIGVIPSNDPALVNAVLGHLGEDGGREVDGRPLRAVLTDSYEISRPSRELVEEIGRRADDSELATLLGGTDRAALHTYLWDRDVLDLLALPVRAPFTVTELLGVLSPIAHRSYSIASSPLVHPGRVDLTVASLRYSAAGRHRAGVCSTHLADRLGEGDTAQVFLEPNDAFRPPEDDTADMIMVGPGTGVAPFRGFLHERRARGARGRNWLFFGARHQRCDALYADELAEMHRDGLLARFDLAFSRDSRPKTYVQQRMQEQGAQLYAWLRGGAHFYVCGDATNMAGDVHATLHEIVAEHGALTDDDAIAFVDELRRTRRYQRDVY